MKATLRFAVLGLSLLAMGCGPGDGSTTDSKTSQETMEASTDKLQTEVPEDPEKSTDETTP